MGTTVKLHHCVWASAWEMILFLQCPQISRESFSRLGRQTLKEFTAGWICKLDKKNFIYKKNKFIFHR